MFSSYVRVPHFVQSSLCIKSYFHYSLPLSITTTPLLSNPHTIKLMEEAEAAETNWSDELGEQLIRELFVDDSSVSVLCDDLKCNNVTSSVCPGPTIGDIERALSLRRPNCLCSGFSSLYPLPKGRSDEMKNKQTVKIKSRGRRLPDDGYRWRKYGQKLIRNNTYPRSYYRCTTSHCKAKKHAQKCTEDPETVIITYKGLHLHYSRAHLLQPDLPFVGLSAASPQEAATGPQASAMEAAVLLPR